MTMKKVNLKLTEGEQTATVEVVLDFTHRHEPTLYRSEHDGAYLFVHAFQNLDGTFDSYWSCLEEALTNGLNPNLVDTLKLI